MVSEEAAKSTQEEQEVATTKQERLIDDDDIFVESSEMKTYVVATEEEAINTNTAPFLRKTFEMVEDPDFDPIVSWSGMRDSFAVWDSEGFSKVLLPKYFRHINFFSFIRQLNTYGFRKVDSERWEFANESFQGGKKHVLKNIKSRRKHNKLHQGSFNSMKPCLKDEVEELKKEQNLLKEEILKLRQQHENSHTELSNVQDRIQCAELKQHQMLLFLTRMVKKPTLVEQLMKKIKRKEELDGVDMVKRRRLLDTTPNVEHRNQGCEQLSILQSELIGFLSEIVNTGKMEPRAPSSLEDQLCSSIQGLRAIGSAASVHDASFAYDVMAEKLMGESCVVDEEVDNVNNSNIYLELKGLISKPTDWIGSAIELVGAN